MEIAEMNNQDLLRTFSLYFDIVWGVGNGYTLEDKETFIELEKELDKRGINWGEGVQTTIGGELLE